MLASARPLTVLVVLLGATLTAPAAAQGSTGAPDRWRLDCWCPRPEHVLERAASLQRLQRQYAAAGVGVRALVSTEHVDDARLAPLGDLVVDAGTTIGHLSVVIRTVGDERLWGSIELDDAFDALAIVTSEPVPDERIDVVTDLIRYVEYFVPDGPAVPEMSARLVAAMPTWGRARAWRYVDDLWNRADRTLARDDARAALRALAVDPWAETTFCDLALRADPFETATAAVIGERMRAVAAANPHASKAWLVWQRAALRTDRSALDDATLAGRLAELEVLPDRQLELIEIAAELADTPQRAEPLLAAGMRLQACHAPVAPRMLQATMAKVLLASGDLRRAGAWLDQLAAPGRPHDVNQAAWQLLTRLDTAGRFDAVALALMERLADGDMRPEYRDTLAVALYGVGRHHEAAELEAKVAAEDPEDPRYAVRQRRFASAVPPPAGR